MHVLDANEERLDYNARQAVGGVNADPDEPPPGYDREADPQLPSSWAARHPVPAASTLMRAASAGVTGGAAGPAPADAPAPAHEPSPGASQITQMLGVGASPEDAGQLRAALAQARHGRPNADGEVWVHSPLWSGPIRPDEIASLDAQAHQRSSGEHVILNRGGNALQHVRQVGDP